MVTTNSYEAPAVKKKKRKSLILTMKVEQNKVVTRPTYATSKVKNSKSIITLKKSFRKSN